MSFDVEAVIKVLGFCLSIAAMVYTFFSNRRKDVDQRFKDGSKRMDRHEARISTLEQTVTTLPEKDDIHELQLEMARMSGSLREMHAIMEGNSKIMSRLEQIVSRHETHLLEAGSHK